MLANAKQFVPPTNKTHGPRINVKKYRNGWRGKKKWENKSIKGKPARKCLWLTVKKIARVEPGRNYHSGQIKCVQYLHCSFLSLLADKVMHWPESGQS